MLLDNSNKYKNIPFYAILLAVLAFGLIVRLAQAKLGLPYVHFWDEPDIASRAIRMMQTGDMNPHFFNYGTLMLYLNYIVDKVYMAYASMLPAGSDAYIANANDIQTTFTSGWHWTISHPAFYFWNRVLTVVMGVGTIIIVYLLGKHVHNRWSGVIGAAWLATLPIHISHSAVITPNIPAMFFMLGVVLFCVLYIQENRNRYFYLALVFAGFSIATKYNAGMVVIMPVLALIAVYYSGDRSGITRWHWLSTMVVPALVVLAVMPYIIIDLPKFTQDVLTEMTHYGRGHRGVTTTPGWTHLSLQLGRVYENIGIVAAALAVAGLVTGLSNRRFLFILIFPALFIWYMSTRSVSFHRNFLLIYPYIAICIGVAFNSLYAFMGTLFRSGKSGSPLFAKSIVTVLATVFIAVNAAHAYTDANKMFHYKETRSIAIDVLNGMSNIRKVVIARELRYHPQDLNRLKYEYSIEPLDAMAAADNGDDVVFLIPAVVSAQYGTDFRVEETRLKQSIIDSVPESDILSVIGEVPDRETDYFSINHLEHARMPSLTKLDILSEDPAMLVVGSLPKKHLDPSVITFENCRYPGLPTKLDYYGVLWLEDGEVTTPAYRLLPGEYAFSVSARSSVEGKEIRKRLRIYEFNVNVSINKTRNYGRERIKLSVFSGDQLISENIYTITGEEQLLTLPFDLADASDVHAVVEFIGDEANPGDPPAIKIRDLSIRKRQE